MNDEERAYNLKEFAAAGSTSTNPGETMAAKVGVGAPDFEARTLDGTVVRLSDVRGKRHVVIMTGAVTSPMCAFEVPALNQLHQEFAEPWRFVFSFVHPRVSSGGTLSVA